MTNIFKQIKYFFLSLQEKNLQQKLKNTTKRSFTNKTTKTIFGTAANVTLNTETKRLIELVNSNVSAIVKKQIAILMNYLLMSRLQIRRFIESKMQINF